MERVGFIGLGSMGKRMAENILADGYELTVFDLRDDAMKSLVNAGAHAADDAATVAQSSKIVLLSLPGPSDVEDAVGSLESGFDEGDVLVDTTTSTPATTEDIADRLANRGVDTLGAPVSGGKAGAAEGTLSIMVGGSRDIFEECRPVFESIASDVFLVGDQPGHGHAMKLLNNYLSFMAMIGTSEATVLGEYIGLDMDTMLDVFNASSGRNTATEFKFPEHIATGRFDMEYEVGLMNKDIRLLLEFAEDNHVPFMVGGTIRQLIGYMESDLGGESDYTRMYEFFTEKMIRDEP